MQHKIYFNKDGWVCERYPNDLPIEDDSKYLEVDEDTFQMSLSCKEHYAWRMVENELVEELFEQIPEEELLENLRQLREEICFPIINRGQLWHDTLTDKQKQELKKWYADWLAITKTKRQPKVPTWMSFSNGYTNSNLRRGNEKSADNN